jgi:hypothetical protein
VYGTWQLILQQPSPLPVEVIDLSGGLVAAVETTQPDDYLFAGRGPRIYPVTGDPSRIVVVWVGGACDASARMQIRQDGTSISVEKIGQPTRPGDPVVSCPAALQRRAVELTFDHTVAAAQMRIVPPDLPTPTEPPAASPTLEASPSVPPEPTPAASPPGLLVVPTPNADVVVVSLAIDVGPNNMQLIISDRSATLESARSATEVEWNAAHATPDYMGAGVRQSPTNEREILIDWGGGLCDVYARLEIRRSGTQWNLFQGPPVGCDAMGVAWFAALTFKDPIAVASVTLDAAPWPRPPITVELAVQMAQRLSQSHGPTVLAQVRQAPFRELYWGKLGDLNPDATAQDLVTLAAEPAWIVTLAGTYRACDASGETCAVIEGLEDFLFSSDYGGLIASRRVASLPDPAAPTPQVASTP